jgi:hypothetical protein
MEEIYQWYSPNEDDEYPVWYYARMVANQITGVAAVVHHSFYYHEGNEWRWLVMPQADDKEELLGGEEHIQLAMLKVEIALGVMPVVRPSGITHVDDTKIPGVVFENNNDPADTRLPKNPYIHDEEVKFKWQDLFIDENGQKVFVHCRWYPGGVHQDMDAVVHRTEHGDWTWRITTAGKHDTVNDVYIAFEQAEKALLEEKTRREKLYGMRNVNEQ